MSNNLNLWSEFAAGAELSEQAAETISGGSLTVSETFTIYNKTGYDITHILDGKAFDIKPNEGWTYTAYSGGIIEFDTDGRSGYVQNKSYNLGHGHVYEYQDNASTPGNPYDIEMYTVG
jgi:hypothetical protein